MRTINKTQKEHIDAVLAESDIGLNPAILEKDIHVTELLHELIKLEHASFRIIFCGGTSLSKARNLIERMSEDVDLKVALKPGIELTNSQLVRQLKAFRALTRDILNGLGFIEEVDAKKTLNEGRYSATSWLYKSVYEQTGSLRPHLSLEFTFRPPAYPTSPINIDYLINRLTEKSNFTNAIECVAVEEILAEKVLSFLRRHAQHRSGHMEQAWDAALVRHIYDVYCIVSRDPSVVQRAQQHFAALVKYDTTEFDRHEAFSKNPKETMASSLEVAENEQQCINEYNTRLIPLIYGDLKPSFEEAFSVFKVCSLDLLATL